MSTGWIRGRFEGSYTGGLTSVRDDGARRFSVKLQSGTVHDAQWVPAPADADGSGGEASLHRRARLGHVRFTLPGEPERLGTLYDLRVEVTKLRRAHEVGGRSFGRLEGVVIARTDPEQAPDDEPPPELEGPAPPPPQPAPKVSEVQATHTPAAAATAAAAIEPETAGPTPLTLPRIEPMRPYVQPIRRTSAQPLEPVPRGFHPAWLLLALVMGWLGLSAWLMCGPLAAASWAMPLVLGTSLRRSTLRLRLRFGEALGWTSAILLGAQLALLVGPAEHAWRADCLPPLGLRLPLLGGLVMLTVLLARLAPIVVAVLCWTLLTFGWCDHVDGTCGERAALARAESRWPKDPERVAAAVAAAPLEPRAREQAAPAPSSMAPATPDPQAAAEPGAAAPTAETSTRAAEPTATSPTPTREPPHPATPLSMEQANRDPASFFASKGKRSVVLPGDTIFGTHGAEVSSQGTIELSRLAALLKLQGKRRVRLELHEEARGDAGREQELTTLQAHAVRTWLEHTGGVDVSRLEVEALGSRRPLAPLSADAELPDTDARLELHVLGAVAASAKPSRLPAQPR